MHSKPLERKRELGWCTSSIQHSTTTVESYERYPPVVRSNKTPRDKSSREIRAYNGAAAAAAAAAAEGPPLLHNCKVTLKASKGGKTSSCCCCCCEIRWNPAAGEIARGRKKGKPKSFSSSRPLARARDLFLGFLSQFFARR